MDVNSTTGWAGDSPLCLACAEGSIAAVQYLLSVPGIDINGSLGTSALERACMKGEPGVLQLLLAHPGIQCKREGRLGLLPLACSRGHAQLVHPLMDHPECTLEDIQDAIFVLVRSRDDTKLAPLRLLLEHPRTDECKLGGEAAFILYLIVRFSSSASLCMLLSSPSFDLNAVDSDGWTALSMAILIPPADMERCFELIDCLRVDINIRCPIGGTPLELASRRGRLDIAASFSAPTWR